MGGRHIHFLYFFWSPQWIPPRNPGCTGRQPGTGSAVRNEKLLVLPDTLETAPGARRGFQCRELSTCYIGITHDFKWRGKEKLSFFRYLCYTGPPRWPQGPSGCPSGTTPSARRRFSVRGSGKSEKSSQNVTTHGISAILGKAVPCPIGS